MCKPLLALACLCCGFAAFGQHADYWESYVQDPHRYRVISPLQTMHTYFVGLQVDSLILNNAELGFVLKEAGFRMDSLTGKTRCFELMYLANVAAPATTIEVELIAFDVRYPRQRAATYRATLANVPNAAGQTLARCQIPVSAPLSEHLGFVVVAKPPFGQMKAARAKSYAAKRLFDGPWEGEHSYGKAFFIYPPVSGLQAYVDPTQEDMPRIEEVIEEMVEEAPTAPVVVPAMEEPQRSLEAQELYESMRQHVESPATEELLTEEVLTFIEVMPEFPGGESAMLLFVANNLKYPTIAVENDVQGSVITRFVVEKDGSLSSFQILRDIGGGCGQEALRVLRSMPKWKPGQHKGRPVRVAYTLPLRFSLNG